MAPFATRTHTMGVAVLFASCTTAMAADESVVIAPRPTAGAQAYLELTQEMEQTNKGWRWGEGQTTKTLRLRGMLLRVDAVEPDGRAKITLMYDRWKLDVDGPRGKSFYDSDQPAGETPNPLAGVFGPMLGMPLTYELLPPNKVTNFRGMDAIFEKVEETAAGNQMFNQLQDEFMDDTVRQTWVDSRLALVPDKPVKLGDTWKNISRVRLVYAGDLEREYSCRLDSIDAKEGRRMATIKYSAEIRRPKDAQPGARMFGIKLTPKSGRIDGTATFDLDRGRFDTISDEMTMLVEGIATGAEPDEESPVSLDMRSKNTLRVRTVEDRQQEKSKSGAGVSQQK